MPTRTKVISFVNYKGGVGKTTLAVEISAFLAYRYNRKVLLIDSDPQTNATFYLMDEDTWEKNYSSDRTIRELFEAELNNFDININDLIVTDGLLIHEYTDKLHLIPSHIELYDIDLKLASRIGAGATRARIILKRHIDKIRSEHDYDFVIIDCPPNMYLVTQNAIVASDGIIVVALPEYLAVRGIALIDRVIGEVIDQINREVGVVGGRIERPEIKGIIFNRVRRGGPYGEILADQRRNIEVVKQSELGDKLFENYISEAVKFPERAGRHVPIAVSEYKSDERYVKELRNVVEEFLNKV